MSSSTRDVRVLSSAGAAAAAGRTALPLRWLLVALTALTAMVTVMAFAAPPALAVVATTDDPDDPFEENYTHSADVRRITFDTTTTPGQVLLKVELDAAPNAPFGAAVFFDLDGDDRADRALEIVGGDADPSRHPQLDGTPGTVRYKVRTVRASTTTCQSFDDALPEDFPTNNPNLFPTVPATAQGMPARTVFTIPVARSTFGAVAAFDWAAITVSQRGPIRFYDLVPDAANGAKDPFATDGNGDPVDAPADPQNPPPGESDAWYCSPTDDADASYGYRVNLAQASRFQLDATAPTPQPTPVDTPPTVSIAQNPEFPRHGRPVTFTATATDDGPITSMTWDLDDNGIFGDATGTTATRTFAENGTYTVAVRVTDRGNHVVTRKRTVTVADRPPSITLTASTDRPASKEKFTLTAAVGSDGSIDESRVEWGFDLSPGDTDPYTVAKGRTWTLSFGVPGTYTMKARVTDAEGRTARSTITVVVPNVAPVFREIRARAKKTPDAFYNTDPLVKGRPILLTTLLTDDNLSRPRVEWDLDGNGLYDDAVGETTERVYTDAGIKTVGVRIVDEAGAVTLGSSTFEVRESEEAGCAGTAGGEGLRAVGCFTPDPKAPKTTKVTSERFTMNGLDVIPKGGAKVAVAVGGIVTVAGGGTVEIRAGTVVLFDGRFEMDANCKPTQQECLVGRFASPALGNVKGFPLRGDVDVYFTPKGTRVSVNVDILGSVGPGVTGRIDLLTGDKTGLMLNSLELRSPMIPIGNLTIGQFFIKYSGETRLWEGGGEITLPTPQFTKLIGDFAFNEKSGILERAHGEVDGLNIPLDIGTVFLQRIAFTMEVKGFDPGGKPRIRFGGGIGVSAGPRVAGVDMATADGDFIFTFGDPFGVDIEGRLSIAGFDVMGGTFGVRTNGHAYMKGFVGFGLPFPKAMKGARQDATKVKVSRFSSNGADVFNPLTQIVSVRGEASAWVEPDRFNMEAAVYAKVLGITLAKAQALLSSKGVAGCGEIVGIGGGFGYEYATDKVSVFGSGCDLGPWRVKPLRAPLDSNGSGRTAAVRQSVAERVQNAAPAPAGGNVGIDVAQGQKALVLKLAGATDDPIVALIDPAGKRYEMPADGAVVQTDDFFAARHTLAEKETYLGVRAPRQGRWTIVPAAGSSAVTEVAGADVLPDPEVKASVRTSGVSRTIRYAIKPIPGQTVTFAEKGPDTYRTVGTARGARGSITFRPMSGKAGTRTIIAIVKQGDLERKHLRVASYRAAAPKPPARPTRLKVTRSRDGRALLTWRSVRGVDGYQVVARISDGRTLFLSTKNTHYAVEDSRDVSIRFEVRSVGALGKRSAPARLRLAAATKRKTSVVTKKASTKKKSTAKKPTKVSAKA